MKNTFVRDALFLARRGIWLQLHIRESLVWTFVMPLVFIYFIGSVTGHAFRQNNRGGDPLGVSATGAGYLSDAIIDRLGASYQVVRTQSTDELLTFSKRLEFPAGFTEAILAGKPMKVRFVRTGGDPGADQVTIARAVYGTLGNLMLASQSSAGVSPASLAAVAAEPRSLSLQVKAAGRRVYAPSGFDQAVPGTLVMFTLLVMFTSGAVTLTIERRGGHLRRLASTPISRGSVVLGRWGACMALGAAQIASAMLAGTFLFHIHWGANLPMVVAILLSYGALAAALGMLLGNFGRTEGQVIGTGVLLSNVLAGLGGCWWPIEITPQWAQHAALLLPTGWTMNALHKLVNFGDGPVEVLPHLAASVIGAMLAGWVLSRYFRFS